MTNIYLTLAASLVAANLFAQSPSRGTIATAPSPQVKRMATSTLVKAHPTNKTVAREGELPTTIITEQPQGTVYKNMYRQTSAYMLYNGDTYSCEIDGDATDVVLSDDGSFYLKNPFSTFKTNSWLKGRKAEGDTIEVDLPQLVYQATEYGEQISYYAYKMAKLTFDINGETYETYDMDTESQTIKFVWRNDSLIKVSEGLLGMGDADGMWNNYGDDDIVVSALTDTIAQPASGVAEEAFSFSYEDDNGTCMKIISGAIDGNNVYLRGFQERTENAWVKGVIDGDKVLFVGKQYMGVDSAYNNHVYFSPIRIDTVAGAGGYLQASAAFEDTLVCNYDAATRTLTANKGFATNLGKNDINLLGYFIHIILSPYSDVAATPQDPVIRQFMSYRESVGYGAIGFSLYQYGTNGESLDPSKLFYNIYYDDNKLTFTPDVYVRMSAYYDGDSMTDVPYEYSDYYDVYTSGYNRVVTLYQNASKVGVQAIYTGGNETRRSAIVYYVPAGIADATVAGEAEKVESVSYTDLCGRRVDSPSKGIYVKTTVYANGKTKVTKEIKR